MDDGTSARSIGIFLLSEISAGDIAHALLSLGPGHDVQGLGASFVENREPRWRPNRLAGPGTGVMNSAVVLESRDRLAASSSALQTLTYALVTPARNEAAFIEQTIRSVIAQTALPRRWIIVSDGSTDGTDEIVQRYARGHDWTELLRMPERRDRQFAAKAHAFNAG